LHNIALKLVLSVLGTRGTSSWVGNEGDGTRTLIGSIPITSAWRHTKGKEVHMYCIYILVQGGP